MVYKLHGTEVIRVGIEETGRLHPKRFIQNTHTNGYHVSTVFIGINLGNEADPSTPICFETIVFTEGRSEDLIMRRYKSYHDALIGHWEIYDYIEKYGELPDDDY